MNILLVGGGGREHAILKKLAASPLHPTIYVLPGNAGMDDLAQCVPVGAKDIDGIVSFAKANAIDFAVVAPDDPLVLGAVDALEALGIPCFGPRANAAIIEGSKVFAKNLMRKYGIPTAAYETFDNMDDALLFVRSGANDNLGWERTNLYMRSALDEPVPYRSSFSLFGEDSEWDKPYAEVQVKIMATALSGDDLVKVQTGN